MSLASLDKEEFERFTRQFEALFNDGDAAGMAAFYTQDVRLLAENTELIQGRTAIEQFWRYAIERARATGAVRTISLGEVTSSGSLGYALGTVIVRIHQGNRMTTKYATIWQRDADGPLASRRRLIQPQPTPGRLTPLGMAAGINSSPRRHWLSPPRRRRPVAGRGRACTGAQGPGSGAFGPVPPRLLRPE